MTGLQKDILEIVLKSQLEIHKVALESILLLRQKVVSGFETSGYLDTSRLDELKAIKESEIKEINRQLSFISPSEKQILEHNKGLKQLLKEQILEFDGEGHEINMYNSNIENWPKEDGEPLDLENWDIYELTDDKMVMTAGGDWQAGGTLTIEVVDGKLTVTNFTNEIDERKELSLKEVIEILKKA